MADEQKPEAPQPPPKPPAKPAAPPPPKAPAVMAVEPWEGELPGRLKEHFGAQILEASSYLGQNFIVVKPDAAVAVLEYLKLEEDFDYLVDITAVDYPKSPDRFEIVYIVYSFVRNERMRIKFRVPLGFQPQTAYSVHLTADWLEREVFDMFGVEFAGHPNMKRLLLPEEWQGHPLRKDTSILAMDNRWVQENLGIESAQ